ncbi:MAG: LLM class flavin-dependent oxidoreductase [Pseudomonadota bacterium]|nr:LLM class flavin-dependent oxidoreductase [Pseudomonadota bacterium]
MTRIGIAFSGGPSPAEIVECVKLAESLGYESAWVAEAHGGDQFSILTACAAQTSTILLGTAISSVFVRSAPTIAMAAATVDEISGGRFILGLGSSHKVQVEPEHGMDYARPITRVRESVDIVRVLLRDGVVQYAGETVAIENFDLWFSPKRSDVPIYLAGLFPKMISVCGEIADGLILTRSTLETGLRARQWIAQGAERCGRNPADVDVTSLLPAALADNHQQALDSLRPGLAFYLGFFPRYNRLIAEYGFAEEAASVAAAWARGDREAATRAVTDVMIEATSVVGTAEQFREKIETYRQSGIDLPIVSPFARGPESKAVFEAVIRACAPG